MTTTNGTGTSAIAASFGLQHEHRHGGEHQRERRLDDEDEPVSEEEPHRLEVDGDAGHELPGLLAVEEAELERLEVLVEAGAEVELDRRARRVPRRAGARR